MDEITGRLLGPDAAELFAREGVNLAYLFGSYARGDAGPLSDVDIAVLFTPETEKLVRFRHVLNLMHALGVILERDDVQVVDLADAPPLLRHRVHRDGILLYGPDDAVRVNFETTALRDYLDTAPLRRLEEQRVYQLFVRDAEA